MRNSAFRPIYYLGCKANFTDAIKQAIDDVDPRGGRLCDLFAGTGAVGAALGGEREVTAIDIQEYSRVLCSAVLAPPGMSANEVDEVLRRVAAHPLLERLDECLQPLIRHELEAIDAALAGDQEPLVALLESPPPAFAGRTSTAAPETALDAASREAVRRLRAEGLFTSADTTVTRYFGGLYFSYSQAIKLDVILAHANAAPAALRDILVAAALSTASSLVNTVGKQFAQPMRPRNKDGGVKANLVQVVRRDRQMDAFETHKAWLEKYATLTGAMGTSVAIRADYLSTVDTLGATFSVLYADPPYTRDHYSRFYHVLETLCLRDEPAISSVTKGGRKQASRGFYREDRHQSPFCIRSASPAAFDQLFGAARRHDLPLVLSYSPHADGDGTHPRVMSLSKIVELARSHYPRVDVEFLDGSIHNQLNNSALKLKSRDHAEVLLKCYR